MQNIQNLSRKKRLLFLGLIAVLIAGTLLASQFLKSKTSVVTKASLTDMLDVSYLTQGSAFRKDEGVTHISLYAKNSYLYKTEGKDAVAAAEFITKNPLFLPPPSEEGGSESLVKGDSTQLEQKLLPENFLLNASLVKQVNDQESTALPIQRALLTDRHYFYTQLSNGVAVFGARLGLHVRNGNEIYAVEGNLINNETGTTQEIGDEQVRTIALSQGSQEAKTTSLRVANITKYVFNKSLLGISHDSKNYYVAAVLVVSAFKAKPFAMEYFIDLKTGTIVYEQSKIYDALDRNVYDYRQCDSQGNCPRTRGEGQGAVGDNESDKAFDILGDVYNYYKNTFGRDSFDGNGASVDSVVHMQSTENFPCPNAAWLLDMNLMIVCDGVVANDVIAHEITHAVIHSIIPLLHEGQSGSLDEGIADIFATAIDKDWTIGEDTVLGVIRNLDDPTQGDTPQPDRLFSRNYYCSGTDSCDRTNDYCGMHHNNGVINKFFYLMVTGGTFNGCSIAGIGEEKAHAIVYRALTTYLTASANFKSYYNAVLQSCSDLYGSEPDTCGQVEKSLRAVEIDQQPDFEEKGALCLNLASQQPNCETRTPQATNTPIPTPTQGQEEPTDTPTPPPAFSPTPTTARTPVPTFQPGNTELLFNFSLQGVGKDGNPNPAHPSRSVDVRLYRSGEQTAIGGQVVTVQYDPATQSFIGSLNIGSPPEGFFDIEIAMESYLRRKLHNLRVQQGQRNGLPPVTFVVGDISGDNYIDIMDYNLVSFICFGKPVTGRCTPADLNDDGKTDIIDVNFLFRNISRREGE